MELTTRQKVEALRDKGLTTREIAQELGITTQAVYDHLKRLREGVPSRSPNEPREVAS